MPKTLKWQRLVNRVLEDATVQQYNLVLPKSG